MASVVSRYLFIDLLRFIAAVCMVQGHVFDALLSPIEKARPLYYLHDVAHGFVPPTFFFLAGAAFSVSTVRRWDEYHAWTDSTRGRITRFLGLIAIGYALHLPYFSLSKILSTATPAEWSALLQADATQCIGVTLLLLQVSLLFVPRRSGLLAIAAAGAVITIMATPLMWSLDPSGVPLWLWAYLNPKSGSWFPLFPSAAFVFGGTVFGYVLVTITDMRRLRSLMRWTVIAAVAATAVTAVLIALPAYALPPARFVEGDLRVMLMRLGFAVGITGALFLVEGAIRLPSRLPVIMGRESLFIYVLHLLIVYGSVLVPGLNQRIGPTLSISEALGVAAAVLLAIVPLTWLWHELNARHRPLAANLKLAAVVGVLFAFVTRLW